MDTHIILYDYSPYARWCTQEDIDYLVDYIFDRSVALPPKCLCIYPSYAGRDGDWHFLPDSKLHFTFTDQRVSRVEKVDVSRLRFQIVSYDMFLEGLSYFVERWLHEVPIKRGGQINVSMFTSKEIRRLLTAVLNAGGL